MTRWASRIAGVLMLAAGIVLLVTGDTREELTTDARFYGFFGAVFLLLSFWPSDADRP